MGMKLGLMLAVAGYGIGIANMIDCDKTKEKRGIKDKITTPELEKTKAEADMINKKLTEENTKAIEKDYNDIMNIIQKNQSEIYLE